MGSEATVMDLEATAMDSEDTVMGSTVALEATKADMEHIVDMVVRVLLFSFSIYSIQEVVKPSSESRCHCLKRPYFIKSK